jgi:hypothetical protein
MDGVRAYRSEKGEVVVFKVAVALDTLRAPGAANRERIADIASTSIYKAVRRYKV